MLNSQLIFSLYDFTRSDEALRLFKNQRPQIIVGFKNVSRFWSQPLEECLQIAQTCREKGALVYLQWDILMTESLFQSLRVYLKEQKIWDHFDGIRVQDSGALQAILDDDYPGEIHFIVEQGNHNLLGLQAWLKSSPKKINRLVLSPELPLEKLKEFSLGLDCQLEYLGFGPLLLFYTPRHLVRPLYDEGNVEEEYHMLGTSEESPHKGFPIRDNLHGTFMFNTKDQFILDEPGVNELPDMYFRVDWIEGQGTLETSDLAELNVEEIKEKYQRPLTKGFFRVNKTDVLFKKLKNSRLQDRGENLLGEVVDVKKDKHIGILINHPTMELSVGESLDYLSPEGREKTQVVKYLRDAAGNEIQRAKKGNIVFVASLGGISIKSLVFKN